MEPITIIIGLVALLLGSVITFFIIKNLDLSIKSTMQKQILDKMFTEQDEFEIEIADKHYLFNFVKI